MRHAFNDQFFCENTLIAELQHSNHRVLHEWSATSSRQAVALFLLPQVRRMVSSHDVDFARTHSLTHSLSIRECLDGRVPLEFIP